MSELPESPLSRRCRKCWKYRASTDFPLPTSYYCFDCRAEPYKPDYKAQWQYIKNDRLKHEMYMNRKNEHYHKVHGYTYRKRAILDMPAAAISIRKQKLPV